MPSTDDAPREPVVGDVDFPPTSGSALGWFGLALVVVALFVALSETSGLVAVRAVAVLLLVGVLMYGYLMRPRVRIADDALVLVNPLSTLTVPLESVSYVRVRAVTRVVVGDRTLTAVGVGRKVREMVRPTAEGVAPTPGSWGGRFLGSPLRTNERSHRTSDTADLVEDTVARAVLQVRDARPAGQHPPPVRRTWAAVVLVPAAVLVVVLAVSLVL